MKTKTMIPPLIISLLAFMLSSLHSQTPLLLNYQGKITSSDSSTALSGKFAMTFSVYGDTSDTTKLWEESHTSVSVANGIFNVLLGSSVALPDDLFTSSNLRYLKIQIGKDPAIRFQMFSPPSASHADLPRAVTAAAEAPINAIIVDEKGRVGIGKQPTEQLDVNGTVQARAMGAIAFRALNSQGDCVADIGMHHSDHGIVQVYQSNGYENVRLTAAPGGISWFNTGGRIGINTDDPQYALDARGMIGGSGGLYYSSDIRWKKDVQQLHNALEKVKHLNGVSFEWRRDEFADMNFPQGRKIGFIGQDMEKVIPEVVNTNEQGYKSIDYAKVTAYLVEAIKELEAKNIKLMNRIESLEKQVENK